ncbi:hypothetical protein C0995_003365 [Termitomyces sp. Mi166|nr:hypothetical protein C0995_003365 [Termitomyces sp. Mi166\
MDRRLFNYILNPLRASEEIYTDYADGVYVYTTLPLTGTAVEDTTKCLFSGYKPQRAIFTNSKFPSSVPQLHEPRYRLAPSFGGLGLFATPLGDLIYAERPLLISPASQNVVLTTDEEVSEEQKDRAISVEIERDLRVAFNRMQPERQTAFLALANSTTDMGDLPLLGISQTNSIPLDLDEMNEENSNEELRYAMVMDQLSRVNHSCIPNAAITFSISSFSAQLHAIRDIKEGEEVFISYCRSTTPPPQRHQALAHYNFKCTCPACLDPENVVKIVTLLMNQFNLPSQYKDKELFYVFPDPQPDFTKFLETSKKRLKLIEDIGLQITGSYDAQLKAVATAAWHLGDDETVMRFLDLRQKWTRAVRGKEIVYSRDADASVTLHLRHKTRHFLRYPLSPWPAIKSCGLWFEVSELLVLFRFPLEGQIDSISGGFEAFELTPKAPRELLTLHYPNKPGSDLPGYRTSERALLATELIYPNSPYETRIYTTLPPPQQGEKIIEDTTECLFYGHKPKRAVFSDDRFPAFRPRLKKPRHHLAPSHGGLSVFAAQDLILSELIICERPLLISPARPRVSVTFTSQPTLEQELLVERMEFKKDLRVAFNRMPPELQAQYLALHNSQNDSELWPLLGIRETNGIPIDLGRGLMGNDEDLQYIMVSDQISRVNHSCTPNAAVVFCNKSFTAKLYGLRDVIDPGEEITISYIDNTMDYEDRQKALAPWGFTCTCPACSDYPEHEWKLARILQDVEALPPHNEKELFFKFPDPQPDPQELFVRVIENMQRIDKAGLYNIPAFDIQVKALATACRALGLHEEALKVLKSRDQWMAVVHNKRYVYSKDVDGKIILDDEITFRPA